VDLVGKGGLIRTEVVRQMTKQDLFEFMAQRRLAVLSSTAADGTPQSALVGIAVSPELEIIFDTVKSSRKYSNLTTRPAASFVIGWEGEVTVQFEGVAEEPVGADLERYREIYFETWPDGRERLSWAGIVHFVVRPTWIRYSDFGARPPRIEELSGAGDLCRLPFGRAQAGHKGSERAD
jgi:general stress protein 26